MTREEAIEILDYYKRCEENKRNIAALNLAITSLSQPTMNKNEIEKIRQLQERTWWDYVNSFDKDSEEYSIRYKETNTKCNALDEFTKNLTKHFALPQTECEHDWEYVGIVGSASTSLDPMWSCKKCHLHKLEPQTEQIPNVGLRVPDVQTEQGKCQCDRMSGYSITGTMENGKCVKVVCNICGKDTGKTASLEDLILSDCLKKAQDINETSKILVAEIWDMIAKLNEREGGKKLNGRKE